MPAPCSSTISRLLPAVRLNCARYGSASRIRGCRAAGQTFRVGIGLPESCSGKSSDLGVAVSVEDRRVVGESVVFGTFGQLLQNLAACLRRPQGCLKRRFASRCPLRQLMIPSPARDRVCASALSSPRISRESVRYSAKQSERA